MLNHPTLAQLNELGLIAMAKAFGDLLASGEAAGLSLTEGLGLLLGHETSYRNDKRLASRLKYANLRHQAVIEDVDYRHPRNLDRALFQKLAGGRLDPVRRNGPGQVVARLCAWPQGLPGQPLGVLSASAQTVRRARARPRRR